MIVDCHTHVWQSPDQLGQLDLGDLPKKVRAASPRISPNRTIWRQIPSADVEFHWSQSGAVDKSIVLGFKSRYLRAEIPNQYVSDYVKRFPQKLIGFAGIDPTERGAVGELRAAKSDLHLRGVTVSPANQDFHPSDSRAMRVYADTLRNERQQRAEEQAQKAAVKILFPTLLCLFPAIFVVILGPAAVQIKSVFTQMK